MSDEKDWEYLGDGVYAKEDCGGIQIHVNSHSMPTDRIYFEPEVLRKLISFAEVKRVL